MGTNQKKDTCQGKIHVHTVEYVTEVQSGNICLRYPRRILPKWTPFFFRQLSVSNGHGLESTCRSQFQSSNEKINVLKTHTIVLISVHSHHLILHVGVLSNLEMV